MADIEFDGIMGDRSAGQGASLTRLINWLGAAISVALVAGLAWWGYQLMVRDVSGVPVVRALQGPMRVAPAEPGGDAAEHQGLAVNDIAAEGEAAAPADRLVLAPASAELAPEDVTQAELAAMSGSASAPSETPAGAAAEPETLGTAEAAEVEPADQSTLIEAALRMAQQVPPAPGGEGGSAVARPDIIDASVPGVSRSPRPPVRPQIASPALVPASAAQTAGDAVRSVDPASIEAGTRLAQIGAFASPDIAAAEWQRVASRFPEVMADKARVIEKGQSGGNEFYRLRVFGFDDLSDARRFCSVLLAGDANCIPVIHR